MPVAFLEFQHITKRFPGVLALDDVSVAVERGACQALMGENGAGKSTLGKILAGVYTPDAGTLRLDGREIRPTTPLVARSLGIAMIHQELAYCPNLSIAENLCLGDLPRRAGWLDRTRLRDRARAMLDEIGAGLDVDQPVGELTTGQQQVVQIAAALGVNARVIVMDEPTSSLSVAESEHLFALINHLVLKVFGNRTTVERRIDACAGPRMQLVRCLVVKNIARLAAEEQRIAIVQHLQQLPEFFETEIAVDIGPGEHPEQFFDGIVAQRNFGDDLLCQHVECRCAESHLFELARTQ